jgi:hypothetical protein
MKPSVPHRARVQAHGRRRAAALVAAAGLVALVTAGPASALQRPASDPFYQYSGTTPLADIAPGTVLKTRTTPYHLAGLPLPVKAVQLAYRSTGQLGQPTVNVTSVLRPPYPSGAPKLVSYQSFYDSLSANDQPSYAIAGGTTLGGTVNAIEGVFVAPWLLKGYTVAIPDTEGQQADFAAGPEYGINTLDGLRAAYNSPTLGLKPTTKAGLIGYSGGAIATEWAAELAPTYAPEIDARLVGAAMGGVLVSPAHNLHYVEGSSIWAGVMPMAIIGAGRAFGVDLTPYLSPYGLHVYKKMKNASIAEVLGSYPGLTWKKLAKPEYPTPESVEVYVKIVNQLIMGSDHTPTTALFIGQGAKGELEGTPGNKPGIGPGDGVMIAGDVRQLARQYCDQGVNVNYREYKNSSHVTSMPTWLNAATPWLMKRFAGQTTADNCSTITPGNSLARIPEQAPADAR